MTWLFRQIAKGFVNLKTRLVPVCSEFGVKVPRSDSHADDASILPARGLDDLRAMRAGGVLSADEAAVVARRLAEHLQSPDVVTRQFHPRRD